MLISMCELMSSFVLMNFQGICTYNHDESIQVCFDIMMYINIAVISSSEF